MGKAIFYVFCKDDATPLFKACHKGRLKVVEKLLEGGANVGKLPVRRRRRTNVEKKPSN